MKVHCLFEQSGTFKNEFKKLGYEAYDYDILNEFGETDYQIDLFAFHVSDLKIRLCCFSEDKQRR